MSRAFGAIPAITALQIATASFAVPKSVMNTIVGRAPAPACPAAALPAGDFPHPQQTRAPAKIKTVKSRIRALIESPKFKCRFAKLARPIGPAFANGQAKIAAAPAGWQPASSARQARGQPAFLSAPIARRSIQEARNFRPAVSQRS